MEKRKYQENCSLDVRRALIKYKRVLLNLPTGAGKTVIATDFVDRACLKNLVTIFVADRVELIEQTFKHFNKAGISCQIIDRNTKHIVKSNVYIAMVETLYRRISSEWFNIHFDLLILDECHMGNYNKLMELTVIREKMIIGLTATPIAASKQYPLNKNFEEIITGPSVPWLIENKYLVKSIDIGQNKLLDLKVQSGEFTPESQITQFSKNNLDNKMIELWKKHAIDRQTIVFNINLDHNDKIVKLFESFGIDVIGVSSKTEPEERAEIISQYKSGRYQVLCNVGITTKGFDSPETSCIVVNRSTASLSLWYQMIGRGGRPFNGKYDFITIDMGNNLLFHGSYNDEIDWVSIFREDERDRSFRVKRKPKLCPICYAYIFNIHIKECPVCGRFLTTRDLLNMEDQMPKELKEKPIQEMNLKELYTYAKYKGYKPGWAWVQFHQRQNKKTLV